MTKTEFFQAHGACSLLLHPEDIPLAKELEEKGYTIVSVDETEDGEDCVNFTKPCDYGNQPYKYGYFAIRGYPYL